MGPDRKRIYGVIGVIAVAVALSAVGLYVQLAGRVGSGPAPGANTLAMPSPAPGGPASGAARPPAPAIDVSAERLAQRLKEKDGSAEDWALLARSYVQLRRYPEAIDAFARALAKMPANPAFLEEQLAARKAATEGAAPR